MADGEWAEQFGDVRAGGGRERGVDMGESMGGGRGGGSGGGSAA